MTTNSTSGWDVLGLLIVMAFTFSDIFKAISHRIKYGKTCRKDELDAEVELEKARIASSVERDRMMYNSGGFEEEDEEDGNGNENKP